MKFEITDIQLFDYCDYEQINDEGDCEKKYSFSANIAINNTFMIQLGTDGEFSIPTSEEARWNDARMQDLMFEEQDADDIAGSLNVGKTRDSLIDDFGAEIMFPENAPNKNQNKEIER